MLITLIRDNIPAKAEAEGVKLNATTAQHDDLFANLLNEKFIEAITAYLSSGSLEALVETQIILDSLTGLFGDRYKEVYDAQIADLGTYSKRYMVVQMQNAASNAAADTPISNENASDTENN